jgi:hypothetical protein
MLRIRIRNSLSRIRFHFLHLDPESQINVLIIKKLSKTFISINFKIYFHQYFVMALLVSRIRDHRSGIRNHKQIFRNHQTIKYLNKNTTRYFYESCGSGYGIKEPKSGINNTLFAIPDHISSVLDPGSWSPTLNINILLLPQKVSSHNVYVT